MAEAIERMLEQRVEGAAAGRRPNLASEQAATIAVHPGELIVHSEDAETRT